MHNYETIIKTLEYTDRAINRRRWWRFIENWKLLLLQLECGQKISIHIILSEFCLTQRMNPVDDFFETLVYGSFTERKEQIIAPRDRFEYVDDSQSSDYIKENHIIQWKENQ